MEKPEKPVHHSCRGAVNLSSPAIALSTTSVACCPDIINSLISLTAEWEKAHVPIAAISPTLKSVSKNYVTQYDIPKSDTARHSSTPHQVFHVLKDCIVAFHFRLTKENYCCISELY